MPPFKNITGQRYGRLTVLSFAGLNKHGQSTWDCLCECGRQKNVSIGSLNSAETKSCGCLQKEALITNNLIHGHSVGGKETPEYNAWRRITQRCTNPKSTGFKNWGGRGIKVCSRWSEFAQFFEDMGKKPGPEYTIERKDNDKDYCPENCKWATRKEQGNNKRNNRVIDFDGKSMTLSQWSDVVGISAKRLSARLCGGWPVRDALTRPKNWKNSK